MQYNYNILITTALLMRLDRIDGFLLLFWPCAFGIALSYKSTEDLWLIPFLLIGSIIMRGVGCIINDLWDQNIDRYVKRTKDRLLTSGKVSNIVALSILGVLLVIGFIILLQLSIASIYVGMLLLPLILLYPAMKRITYWPQLFLGLIFNSGIIIVSLHMNNHIPFDTMLLYMGTIFWTLGYDTIYAFADYEDDIRIDIKSLAVLMLHSNYRGWLLSFYCIFISTVVVNILHYGSNLLALAIMGLVLVQCIWQTYTLNINDSEDCIRKFQSNRYVGLLSFVALLICRTQNV